MLASTGPTPGTLCRRSASACWSGLAWTRVAMVRSSAASSRASAALRAVALRRSAVSLRCSSWFVQSAVHSRRRRRYARCSTSGSRSARRRGGGRLGVGEHEGGLGDDEGVGAVVLGQAAACFGEQADAARVHAHDLDACGLQAVDEGDLVSARGFEAEALGAGFGEPGGELGVALGGVGHAQRVLGGPERAVEPKLADIGAGGGNMLCHLRIPSLQSGLGDLATVRADEDAGRAPSSPSGWTQRWKRAPPRRSWGVATPQDPHPCGTKQTYKGRGEGVCGGEAWRRKGRGPAEQEVPRAAAKTPSPRPSPGGRGRRMCAPLNSPRTRGVAWQRRLRRRGESLRSPCRAPAPVPRPRWPGPRTCSIPGAVGFW